MDSTTYTSPLVVRKTSLLILAKEQYGKNRKHNATSSNTRTQQDNIK